MEVIVFLKNDVLFKLENDLEEIFEEDGVLFWVEYN